MELTFVVLLEWMTQRAWEMQSCLVPEFVSEWLTSDEPLRPHLQQQCPTTTHIFLSALRRGLASSSVVSRKLKSSLEFRDVFAIVNRNC